MKAILFESKAGMEVQLENNVSFFSEENETKEDFVARVTEAVERDYVEQIDLQEFDPSNLKKRSVKQLQKAIKSKKGIEAEIIKEILIERGALTKHPSEGGHVYNSTDGAEDLPEGTTEEGKEEEKKEPKKLKKQVSDEEALANLEEAQKNKGREITFMCTKTKEMAKGVIKGVRLDKRNNFIQYRILAEDGAMYGKGIDSEDITLGDFVPVEEKPKKEKAPATEEAPPETTEATEESSEEAAE